MSPLLNNRTTGDVQAWDIIKVEFAAVRYLLHKAAATATLGNIRPKPRQGKAAPLNTFQKSIVGSSYAFGSMRITIAPQQISQWQTTRPRLQLKHRVMAVAYRMATGGANHHTQLLVPRREAETREVEAKAVAAGVEVGVGVVEEVLARRHRRGATRRGIWVAWNGSMMPQYSHFTALTKQVAIS